MPLNPPIGVDGSMVTLTKAGTPADADFGNQQVQNGTMVLDTTANKLWIRVGTVWKFVALT